MRRNQRFTPVSFFFVLNVIALYINDKRTTKFNFINKELQDLSWSSLPKEMRDKIKKEYQINLSEYDRLSQSAVWNESSACWTKYKLLEALFGIHNLTSDTEPKEMLMVERKKVVEYYREYKEAYDKENDPCMKSKHYGKTVSLHYFFGDKCLSDKEEIIDGLPHNENYAK